MELEEVHLNIIPRVPGWDQRRFTTKDYVMWLADGLLHMRRRHETTLNSYHTLILPVVHLCAILPKRPVKAPWESEVKKRGRPRKEQATA